MLNFPFLEYTIEMQIAHLSTLMTFSNKCKSSIDFLSRGSLESQNANKLMQCTNIVSSTQVECYT